MENLDISSLELNRDASTCVSDFSVSIDDEESGDLTAVKPDTAECDDDLSTDYSKVSVTLVEVNIYEILNCSIVLIFYPKIFYNSKK